MDIDNMPTTNQNSEETYLSKKIPPTVAEGFEKVTETAANSVINSAKEAASSDRGMSNS